MNIIGKKKIINIIFKITYRTDQNKEKIKQIVKSSFIEETLNFAHCKKPESSRLQVKEIFLAILSKNIFN